MASTSSVIRNSFRYNNLNKFIASLSGSDTLYLGIGRPQLWDTNTSTDNVDLGDDIYKAKDTWGSEKDDRSDLLSMKRINPAEVSFGIKYRKWTAGKSYDTYRHDYNGQLVSVYDNSSSPANLSEANYVVITASYDIYICLKQGMTGVAVNASTYSPETGVNIGTNTGVKMTADGYYWKYIATTSVSDYTSFSSLTHFPVRTLTSDPGGAYHDQWVSQTNSASFKSGIYVINVISGGTGYNGGASGTRAVTNAETDAEFKVIGDGSGLQYTVTYTSGVISDIQVTNPGNGYTFATITAAGGINAAFDIIFTPSYGLGCNPIKDTSALFMLVSVTLADDEGGDFTVANDYRKVMLISNPFNTGTSVISTASTLDATTTLMLSSVSSGSTTFTSDEIVTIGGAKNIKARVVDFRTSNKLRIIRTSSEQSGLTSANENIAPGDSVAGSGTGTIGGASGDIIYPEVDIRSGDIIYSEYRGPVLRQVGQTEVIKIIVEF